METFGDRLRSHREAKGVTTWMVEKQTGISRSNLISIEKGRRPASDDVLRKLASIAELELSYDLLKAWRRLDGATYSEMVEMARELVSPEEFDNLVDEVLRKRGLLKLRGEERNAQ